MLKISSAHQQERLITKRQFLDLSKLNAMFDDQRECGDDRGFSGILGLLEPSNVAFLLACHGLRGTLGGKGNFGAVLGRELFSLMGFGGGGGGAIWSLFIAFEDGWMSRGCLTN